MAEGDVPFEELIDPLDEVTPELEILTSPDNENLPDDEYIPIKFGVYTMEESELSKSDQALLHGRGFVVNFETVDEIDSSNPRTYYIATDQVQGLVIPGRSMAIANRGGYNLNYRWTDDGEKWTNWLTLLAGASDVYPVDEKCRFAEVQVYSEVTASIISLVCTR